MCFTEPQGDRHSRIVLLGHDGRWSQIADGAGMSTPPCVCSALSSVPFLLLLGCWFLILCVDCFVVLPPLFGWWVSPHCLQVEGEVLESMVAGTKRSVSLPGPLKSLASAFMNCKGQTRAVKLLANLGEKTVQEFYKCVHKRNEFRDAFFRAWTSQHLDVVICPAHVLPAIPHDSFSKVHFTACPTMLYNMLDYPAGVVPITTVRTDDTCPDEARDFFDNIAMGAYSSEKMAGLPVGVQVRTHFIATFIF